jgi:hypothetical protein
MNIYWKISTLLFSKVVDSSEFNNDQYKALFPGVRVSHPTQSSEKETRKTQCLCTT